MWRKEAILFSFRSIHVVDSFMIYLGKFLKKSIFNGSFVIAMCQLICAFDPRFRVISSYFELSSQPPIRAFPVSYIHFHVICYPLPFYLSISVCCPVIVIPLLHLFSYFFFSGFNGNAACHLGDWHIELIVKISTKNAALFHSSPGSLGLTFAIGWWVLQFIGTPKHCLLCSV